MVSSGPLLLSRATFPFQLRKSVEALLRLPAGSVRPLQPCHLPASGLFRSRGLDTSVWTVRVCLCHTQPRGALGRSVALECGVGLGLQAAPSLFINWALGT